jgi:Tn3 transposase DDE domain
MSDAQRLEGGAADALRAAAAREFGYRRGGVSLLSWVSDMYVIYGQKIVTLAGRESTYTLDEIAHNPILDIQRHTTDTYGCTDLLFALFDLIGKTFHPRIRDLQSHVDYRLGPGQPELQVDQLLLRKRVARPQIIIERWDEMQRAAASLIHGWVTSSMLISRLQAQPQQNPLAEALIEYGRILRTNHGCGDAPTRSCAATSARCSTRARKSTIYASTSGSAARANPHLKPRDPRAHRALPRAGHELHHQLERPLPNRDHRPARTRRPPRQRDRPRAHVRDPLRARQPARPLPIRPPRTRRRQAPTTPARQHQQAQGRCTSRRDTKQSRTRRRLT